MSKFLSEKVVEQIIVSFLEKLPAKLPATAGKKGILAFFIH